jgi:phosphoserine aminotransferase
MAAAGRPSGNCCVCERFPNKNQIREYREMTRPTQKPNRPFFSSGPCAKRPGWSPAALSGAWSGRSHRAAGGKAKLAEVAIVPASDTGAVEMALWSLLGARGTDMLVWESFGKGWATDVTKQLKLEDVRVLEADYGDLPDLTQVDFARDVVFTWNGTTSGVCVPNGDWIAADREGLTICDATSAAFAMDLPWDKLDVATWSWQKVLGGEGAHGMLVLSPRAVERLETHAPAWPLPKIFRLTKGGKLIEGIFRGETINTPSMLCVEDAIDSLKWAEEIGGLPKLIQRSRNSLAAVSSWVEKTPWVEFLAKDPAMRSCTSICLGITDTGALGGDEAAAAPKKIAALLEKEGVAFDIGAYRDAPPGFRIWGGATVEPLDLQMLMPWIEWAHEEVCAAPVAAK